MPIEIERRQAPRTDVLVNARLRSSEMPERDITICNVSRLGLMARVANPPDLWTCVELAVPGIGWVPAFVSWVEGGRVGVCFDHDIDVSTLQDA